MSTVDVMIESLKGHLKFCIQQRHSASVLVWVSSQNTYKVQFELAKLFITAHEGMEVDFLAMSANEIMEKGERYRQSLYFSHHVHVDVMQKAPPCPAGDFLRVDVANYTQFFFDMDPCEVGQAMLS